MVQAGEADGLVSGLDSRTKPFLPAFEIVRAARGLQARLVASSSWSGRTASSSTPTAR